MTGITQAALGVGALLVTAGVIASSILLTRNPGANKEGPGVILTPRPTLGPSISCGVNPDVEVAEGVIFLGGIKRNFTERELVLTESAFVDVYNQISAGCDDIYQRFLQSVEITNQTTASGEGGQPYLDTRWNAVVKCDGCWPSNPLFQEEKPYETENTGRF
jgi:hypothetical protein